MTDLTNKKVPIFTGINDTPIAPTSSSGGNISHFYGLYNGLIDEVEGAIGANTTNLSALTNYVYDDLLEQINNSSNTSSELTNINNAINNLSTLVNGLNTIVEALTIRVQALEEGSDPVYPTMPIDYTLAGLNLATEEIRYAFTESGVIDKILLTNSVNAYDIYFSIDGNILTSASFTEVSEGTEITFSDDTAFNAGSVFGIFVASNSQSDVTITLYLV
jgi:hypothetical protein